MAGTSSRGSRLRLVRDVVVFQVKLGAEALLDITLIPVSLAAAALDFLLGNWRRPRWFHSVLRFGERCERRIDLWGVKADGNAADLEIAAVMRSIETLVRQPGSGPQKVRELTRWAAVKLAPGSARANHTSGISNGRKGQWAMPTDFIGFFAILAAARVRFVLVGGLALVLHGLDRLTADVDLVIDLSGDPARAAVQALTEAGYRPLAPVDPIALVDPEQRRQWQTVRNMQVFSFWDSSNMRPTVDIMLSPEVPFEELWAAALAMNIGGHEVRVASIEHLIRLKVAAGRPQDLADIERLRAKLQG